MTAEPYVPSRQSVRSIYVGAFNIDPSDEGREVAEAFFGAEFDRFIAKVRADAVRGFAHEVQRGLDREHPRLDQDELSTRITLIAEADAYAQRIEEEA